MNEIVFSEYEYIDISGSKYYPIFNQDKKYWYLISTILPFEQIALMCNIPEGEAVFLKLKYGG